MSDLSFHHFGFGADETQGRIAYRFTTLRFFEEVLVCVFLVGGFWEAPPACESITPSHYNICVYLRLSAVEMKKINRRCTQMHADAFRVGFWLACAPFF